MMFDMADLPQPNEAFTWVQAASGPALVCRPLAVFAPHVFTTRGWGLGSRIPGQDGAAWAEVAGALNLQPADLVRVRQVHGMNVLAARSDRALPAEAVPADIIVTDRTSIGLAVQVADCVPLLIADRRTGAVAAAHAGWRGLAARVPSEAVAAFGREFGGAPEDLLAAIGPSVGACCYEVGMDVRQAFAAAGFRRDQVAGWFSDEPHVVAHNPAMEGLARPRRPDHWFFDGWASTRDQLIDAGVPPDSVFLSELCTASHPGALCSFRRDGPPAGRMAGAIRRPPPGP